MKYKMLLFFLLINVFSLVYAEEYFPPSLPDNIYGNFFINENTGEIDSIIIAKINDVTVNTSRTTELGKYGSQEINNRFLIFDNFINIDKKIIFYLLINNTEILGTTVPEEIFYLGGETQNANIYFTVQFDNNNEDNNEDQTENTNHENQTQTNNNTTNNSPLNNHNTTSNYNTIIENKILEEIQIENNEFINEEKITDIEEEIIEKTIVEEENLETITENLETVTENEKNFEEKNIIFKKNNIFIYISTIIILITISIIIYLKYIKTNKEKYVKK